MTRLLPAMSKAYRGRPAIALAAVVALVAPRPAQAALLWDWSYAGTGIAAAGSFTTTDASNSDGFYQITSISGFRNGAAILQLQPAGTAIPGNEGFPVDNLVNASERLTGNGFGFKNAEGNYSNAFFADFLTTPGFLEVFTQPATNGFSEVPVVFTATVVPEPGTAALLLTTVGGLASVGRCRRNG